MKILVMHQVPYRKIQYHLAIDHDRHDVTYFGTAADLDAIPENLRCRRVELDQAQDLADQIVARTAPADGFEHVLALSEFGILEAARIRAHLGIPGPSPDRLERIRDKVVMKQALAVAGVRHPRFVAAPSASQPLPWSGRTVVKHRRGASSANVSIHDTTHDALSHYWKLLDRAHYELEEYVEGDLLHADGLVSGGVVGDLVVSRYIGKPIDFATGGPMGSSQLPDQAPHHAFIVRAIEALGVEEGCIHVEYFETQDGELIFLEAANRLGGGGIVDAHLRHTGVHLPTHEIAIRLNLERPERRPTSGRYHGFVIFPGHHLAPGVRWHAHIPEAVRTHPFVDRIHTLEPADESSLQPGRVSYQEWEVPVFIEASHTDASTLAAFLGECALSVSVLDDDVVLQGGAS